MNNAKYLELQVQRHLYFLSELLGVHKVFVC